MAREAVLRMDLSAKEAYDLCKRSFEEGWVKVGDETDSGEGDCVVSAGLDRAGLGWVGLGWVELGWVGLGWVLLGWVGLGWVGVEWGWVGVEWGSVVFYLLGLDSVPFGAGEGGGSNMYSSVRYWKV